MTNDDEIPTLGVPVVPAAAVTAQPVDGGAKAITQDLMARLQRHYLRPGAQPPGGVFLAEVSPNGGWGAGRRCDAIFVGFTATSGRLMIGHEVKATRSDWLHELKQLAKATYWADACHEWWVVATPGVVKVDELPPGWGLLEPGARTRTRMKTVVAARRDEDLQPSWDAVRSVLARLDTLHRDELQQQRVIAHDQASEQYEAALKSARDRRMSPEHERRLSALGDLEKRLGVTIGSGYQVDATPAQLHAALALVHGAQNVGGERWSTLPTQIRQLQQTSEELQALHDSVTEFLGTVDQSSPTSAAGMAS